MAMYRGGDPNYFGINMAPKKAADKERETSGFWGHGEITVRPMTEEEWKKYGPVNQVDKKKSMWADQRVVEKAKVKKKEHPITKEEYVEFKKQGLKDREIIRKTPKLSASLLANLKQLWIAQGGNDGNIE